MGLRRPARKPLLLAELRRIYDDGLLAVVGPAIAEPLRPQPGKRVTWETIVRALRHKIRYYRWRAGLDHDGPTAGLPRGGMSFPDFAAWRWRTDRAWPAVDPADERTAATIGAAFTRIDEQLDHAIRNGSTAELHHARDRASLERRRLVDQELKPKLPRTYNLLVADHGASTDRHTATYLDWLAIEHELDPDFLTRPINQACTTLRGLASYHRKDTGLLPPGIPRW